MSHSATSVFTDLQRFINEEQDKREVPLKLHLLQYLSSHGQKSGAIQVYERNGRFQEYFGAIQEIRVVVRDLEQQGREILAIMQIVHQPDGLKNVSAVTTKARGMFDGVQKTFKSLAEKVPENQYYRFHDHWRFVMQRLNFLAAFIVYLETETMIECEEAAVLLGVKSKREDGFHMDLDDYLMGLLQLASELSRFAINAVTSGDYHRPVRIAKFLGDLDAGFRLLNLKNDSLRKRFDGLKYDLKKVEEVVYDVTIRGLLTSSANVSSETETAE